MMGVGLFNHLLANISMEMFSIARVGVFMVAHYQNHLVCGRGHALVGQRPHCLVAIKESPTKMMVSLFLTSSFTSRASNSSNIPCTSPIKICLMSSPSSLIYTLGFEHQTKLYFYKKIQNVSFTDRIFTQGITMRKIPELTIQSKKSAVLTGHTSKVHLLCKLLGADTPTELPKRSPLHLSIVLDRSGSMSGAPLEEAKKCAINIVNRLGSTDKVSIVTYDNNVDVVTPLTSVDNPSRITRSIGSIRAGGMTNLLEVGKRALKNSKVPHPKILCLVS